MKRFAPFTALCCIAVAMVACVSSEEAAIERYFIEAQDIAERLVAASTEFQTLMDVQDNPLAWSNEAKAQIEAILTAFHDLEAEAADMSVPPSLIDVHPLLLKGLGDMSGAVQIIVDIANDPLLATIEKANEMTNMAESAEKASGEYVEKLQAVLEAKYPELLEE